jgi:rhodanese-related sulfurtransferase
MTQDIVIKSITVQELQDALNQENPPLVLDVREESEIKICTLPTFLHIPLGKLANALQQIPHNRAIVTVCHHGIRSYRAAVFLKQNGFEEVLNLIGGINAWAIEIDPKMARY